MKAHLFILTLFCQLFFWENSAVARGPAVEPVTGLSIEEYNQSSPTDSSGYDFTTSQAKTSNSKLSNSISRSIATNRAPERSIESLYDKTSSEYVFLIILGVLPFIIWFGLMKTIDSIEQKYRTRPYLISSQDDDDDDENNDGDSGSFPRVS